MGEVEALLAPPSPRTQGSSRGTSMVRRAAVIVVALGAWLFASTMRWPDTHAELVNTRIAGILAIAFGCVALLGRRWGQAMIGALGVWLIVSPMLFPPAG